MINHFQYSKKLSLQAHQDPSHDTYLHQTTRNTVAAALRTPQQRQSGSCLRVLNSNLEVTLSLSGNSVECICYSFNCDSEEQVV